MASGIVHGAIFGQVYTGSVRLMTEGWLISLILSNVPSMVALVLIACLLLAVGIEAVKGTKGLGVLFSSIFFICFSTVIFCILLLVVSIVCTIVFFPAIFSVVNLIFILIDNGLDGLVDDLASGVLALRVCSIVSVFTTINFLAMESSLERDEYMAYVRYSKSRVADDGYGVRIAAAHTEYENHPATLYSSSTKSAGNSGNMFFFSTIICLWMQYILGYESIFFSLTSFVLLFIIDDWALLIHFKIHAEKSVTKMHRIRLYSSFIAIVFFTLLAAFDVNDPLLYAASLLVFVFGLRSFKKMKLEERYLKEIAN
ncbi:hypothetical protein [Lysobacter brunescens]|uniref:Uncharacterized protein n=1 Tax=Lysobacter brunescens TaxID=262323 RepID=A0ABW2YDZ1_9GAMM